MIRETFVAIGAFLAALDPLSGHAQDAPAWPPSAEARSRIAELQAVMSARDSTPAQREAAREALARLLRHPDAAEPEELPAVRAAIAPFPPIPAPAPALQARTATLVAAPRAIPPLSLPIFGLALPPAGRVVIDPATGALFRDTGLGFIDPATGRRIPKR